jgi:hypothetical protein
MGASANSPPDDEGVIMRTPDRPARRLATAVAALALGMTALAGCSGGDDSGAGSGAADPTSGAASDASAAGSVGQDGTAKEAAPVGPAVPSAVDPAVLDRKLSRRADISVTVADVDVAATQVRSIAAAAKGIVLSEAISSEPDVPETGGYSTITISVPTDALDATLDRVAELGDVHARNASTEDVTAQYVDTESRIETMRASVERVRALMGQATRLADIVTLEAELSRRQADLEALQSQLGALDDAVTLAPIEVRLSTDESVLEQAEDDTGFLAGLAAGWDAFTTSVAVLLTAIGAVLPFAVVIAAVAVPLLVWLRRRGARPLAPTAQPGPPAASPPAA